MHVFVSYHRSDQAAVAAMAGVLRRAGHDVWLDARLRPGQTWWSEILDAIERADVVVIALSPQYLESDACGSERRYAEEARRSILPVEIVPVNKKTLPGDLAVIHVCESVDELVDTLASEKPAGPLPHSMPKRPPPPLSELAAMRDRIKEGPLDEATQFAIVAELILAHRSPVASERETARLLLVDSATSRFLFQRPAQLIQDELNARRDPDPLPPSRPRTPRLVIIGAALSGIALFSFLSMLGVYRVLPRPYEVVGPHSVLVVAGTVMCLASLRRHRLSAVTGLTICIIGLLAIIADLIKNNGF